MTCCLTTRSPLGRGRRRCRAAHAACQRHEAHDTRPEAEPHRTQIPDRTRAHQQREARAHRQRAGRDRPAYGQDRQHHHEAGSQRGGERTSVPGQLVGHSVVLVQVVPAVRQDQVGGARLECLDVVLPGRVGAGQVERRDVRARELRGVGREHFERRRHGRERDDPAARADQVGEALRVWPMFAPTSMAQSPGASQREHSSHSDSLVRDVSRRIPRWKRRRFRACCQRCGRRAAAVFAKVEASGRAPGRTSTRRITASRAPAEAPADCSGNLHTACRAGCAGRSPCRLPPPDGGGARGVPERCTRWPADPRYDIR